MWLFVFAAGFRAALGLSIAPPYETYITYETYIVPGLAGMIQLFNGMQSSLSMVYDREMGSMRVLLSSQTLYWLCALNPFTHVVESIRFALYAQFNALSLAATAITLAVFAVLAVLGYDPRHGMIKRQVA
jgi:ABC-2 type transport system permease protein